MAYKPNCIMSMVVRLPCYFFVSLKLLLEKAFKSSPINNRTCLNKNIFFAKDIIKKQLLVVPK